MNEPTPIAEASFEIACAAAVDCDVRARQLRKGRLDFARQAYKAATGIDLEPVPYTDVDGSLWEIAPYVDLRLIRRGAAGETL